MRICDSKCVWDVMWLQDSIDFWDTDRKKDC